jgi:Bifunctional DNA primase/polymerase, N-terminal
MNTPVSNLIDELSNIPSAWQLTPLGKVDRTTGLADPKAPYLSKWQKTDVTLNEIESAILKGQATGYGLRLGEPSGYVMAIDFDGQSAIDLGKELFGELPETVTWTSGRPGRYQALFVVSEQYRDRVKNKTIKTGVIGDDGKLEQIELRYTGLQSALPPSAHPDTDGYYWINNPLDTEVAELPQNVIDYWLEQLKPKSSKEFKPEPKKIVPRTIPKKGVEVQGEIIPLENCLAVVNREVLDGVGDGDRHNRAIALAFDLIGSANYLESIGHPYTGEPRYIFDRYCRHCSPPLGSTPGDNHPDTIWESAQKENPTPSCTTEGVDNILKAWNKKAKKDKSATPTEQKERESASGKLLEIAKTATYFHTSDKIAYADVSIDGNRHTYSVRSKAFRLWLSGEYLDRTEKGIGSQTLQDTLSTLEAIAIFRGETREVHLRTAEYQGKIYLDLGTDDWKAIEVDSSSWRLLSDPPVRFWRPDSLLPLPIPVTGGNLDELKDLLNVDGSSWTLIVTFLLFCFCPDKTYPVLVLSAHRGSGKTAAAEIIKGLIDPGKAALIKLQNDTHKLAVAATRRHLMVYDNVSHISPDQSDDLCRIATGFGFSTRTLHTTDEETTFELTRPQIITAIDALITRDDLADRVLMAQLPEIPEVKRLPQSELNTKVGLAKPKILGALLTALSQTLAQLPNTKPESLPRMADYALFAIASEKALGLKKGEFMKVFNQSREESRQVVIESSPVGEAVVSLMSKLCDWTGTASQLLEKLKHHTDDTTYRSRYFPHSPNRLSYQLTRLTPDLATVGIQITCKVVKGTKLFSLVKIEKPSVPSAPYLPQTPTHQPF